MADRFVVHWFKVDERAMVEALGFDYDEHLRYREERKQWDPEILRSLDDLHREMQRRFLGLA